MRETSSRGWHRRRFSAAMHAPVETTFDRMTNLADLQPVTISSDQRGPDGIRHELVARIRQQIADGTYDTEEKWLLAEEALLRRIEGRA